MTLWMRMFSEIREIMPTSLFQVHTAGEDQEVSAANLEESLPPHPHLHQPLGSLVLSPSRGDNLRRQILAQFHVDPAGSILQGATVKCSMFPDFKLCLSDLFRYGLNSDRESSPAPCSEAGLLRILLQLLRALEYLQQEGWSHGNILSHQVYVMEDLRITLGGLDSCHSPAEEKRHAWASEGHPKMATSQDTVPDLIFRHSTDSDLQIPQSQVCILTVNSHM